MAIIGVLLFSASLIACGVVLLADSILENINKHIAKQEEPATYLLKIQSCATRLHEEDIKIHTSWFAFLISIWNLFAPDFGSHYGAPTIFGALLPVAILFLDTFILYPKSLEFIPFENIKAKMILVLEKITPFAGWLTLAAGVMHIILFRLPLF